MMKKTLLSTAVVAALSAGMGTAVVSTNVGAATLNFDAGAKFCVYGVKTDGTCKFTVTGTTGSYFSMDADGSGTVSDSEKTIISQLNGITVDGVTTQAADGSHGGAPGSVAGENPDIDNPWFFFNNTGMHQTTAPISVVSNDGAGNVGLDFTGWNVTWNGIASIPMGGDAANFGTNGGTINTGVASMVCNTDCSDGDTYVLDYAAQVPNGDPSNFGGVPYRLHLEGTISGALPATVSGVPVPAAVWLFGSGLIGLAGVARRRKSA